jgi:hypothetical protein
VMILSLTNSGLLSFPPDRQFGTQKDLRKSQFTKGGQR